MYLCWDLFKPLLIKRETAVTLLLFLSISQITAYFHVNPHTVDTCPRTCSAVVLMPSWQRLLCTFLFAFSTHRTLQRPGLRLQTPFPVCGYKDGVWSLTPDGCVRFHAVVLGRCCLTLEAAAPSWNGERAGTFFSMLQQTSGITKPGMAGSWRRTLGKETQTDYSLQSLNISWRERIFFQTGRILPRAFQGGFTPPVRPWCKDAGRRQSGEEIERLEF